MEYISRWLALVLFSTQAIAAVQPLLQEAIIKNNAHQVYAITRKDFIVTKQDKEEYRRFANDNTQKAMALLNTCSSKSVGSIVIGSSVGLMSSGALALAVIGFLAKNNKREGYLLAGYSGLLGLSLSYYAVSNIYKGLTHQDSKLGYNEALAIEELIEKIDTV